jgi:hypothetical protein
MPVSLQLISIEPQLPIPVYYLQKTSTFKITDTVNVSRFGGIPLSCDIKLSMEVLTPFPILSTQGRIKHKKKPIRHRLAYLRLELRPKVARFRLFSALCLLFADTDTLNCGITEIDGLSVANLISSVKRVY